ncbi:Ig-like domain-containing protein, partial [Kistimonas scapharcae]|uniref:Ig-like domain-containing protein n=1 Tax=Kistimonas scapharcae TaxID=1036133 RepID=UPI003CD076F9
MVNHAPVAVDDFGTLSENSIFAVDVVANDTDQNSNDQLTIQPGSVTLLSARDGDGNTISLDTARIIQTGNRIEFDPGQDFDFLTIGETARVQISYTVQDNAMQSETDDGILSLTITGVKETARAEDIQLDAFDDQSAIVGAFSAVEEFDTNPYHYRLLREPDEGHVTNNHDGTFSFEPGDDFRDLAEGETRQVTFTYEAVDETGAPSAAPATVTLTVTGTNDRPVAEVVNVSLPAENSAMVAGQFKVTDADTTDRHSFNILSQPSQGTVINNHDGTFSFDPGTDFTDLSFGEERQVTFTYEAVDDSGTANARSAPATVVLTVTGTNDQPEAQVVAITNAVEDSAAVTGSFRVSDEDIHDTHTFTVLTQPLEGQVVNNNDGTFSFNPGSDFQDLAAGETRQVTFTYAAVDSSGAENAASEPATVTVTVTVTGTNDRPVANDLSLTQGAAVSPTVSGRFSALDWDTSDTVTFNLLEQPAQGIVTNNNDGTYSFDPDGAFDDLASGETRQVTFTYEAVDDSSSVNQRSEAATVTVIVTGTNDAPVASIDTGAGHEHETLLLNVLANDSDSDHNDNAGNFSLDAVQVVDNNGDPLAGNGSVRILNNQLEFNPGNDFNHLAAGETATVTVRYVMSDDEGASAESTVTITVTGTNDAPVAKADYPISEEGLIPSLTSSSDQGIQVTSSGEVSSHFSAWKAMDNVDASAVNNSNSWATTGNSGWLQVELPEAHSVMQYSLTGIALTLGREPSEWQLLASNDGVNFVVVDTQTTQTGWASRETRTYTLSEPAEYRYFRLDITDNNGDSYTGLDAFQLYEGTNTESVGTEHDVLTVDVLANDIDPDNNSGSSSFTLNTVETVDSDGNPVAGQGAVTVVNNQLQFDPGNDFNALAAGESAVVTVRYVMSDSDGMTSESTARIVVKGTNDQPVAEAVSVTTAVEDNGSVTGHFSATDLDVSDTHTFNLLTSPQEGAVINNHDGTFRFDPGNDFQDLSLGETSQVTFTYEAIDSSGEGNAASNIGTVTVTVTGANDGPTAVVDTGQTTENSSVTVDVIGNDSDIDSADTLSLKSGSTSIVSAVDQQSTAITLSSASVSQVGNSIRFDPGTDFDFLADGEQATVTVNYQVQDNHGATDQGSLTITVTGSNDGPVAVADSGSVSEDNLLSLDVVANDSDPDRNDSLTLERVAIIDSNGDPLTGHGSVTIVNNQLQFNPDSDFSYLASGETATVSVQYDITDSAGERSQAIATITVTGTNSTPEATADISGGHENEVLMIDVLANDTDIDHSDTPANFSLNSARVVDGEGNTLAGQGSVSVVNNELRFDPGSDFDVLATGETATVTVRYVMADDEGALSESTVTITVTGTNDAPVARADSPLSEDGFIPVLQSGNEQGYTITASGQLSDNFAAYQAFDQVNASETNNVNSWATQGSSGWLQVELPETTSILQYSMKGIAQTIGREPSEWQLLGSNDGVTFTVIDSRSAVTDWSPRETKQFTLSAPAEFRFFKIDITDNNGDSYTGLDEFQLYEGTNTDSVGTEHDVLTIDVVANDRDPDHSDNAENLQLRNAEIINDSGDPVTGQGTATVINNQLQFDPGNDFNALALGETATITVRYVVEDDEGASSESTATITVTGTNDKPTAEVKSISATEDGAAVTGSFGASDADTTDIHTFNILTQPDEGSVINNGDGTFSFNPGSDFQDLAAGETRQVTFTYEAVDDSGTANDTSEPATVTITITGTNDKPTSEVKSISATEDGAAVTGNFGATDADTTDTHTFNILTQPSEGTVTNNNDGTFSFNPGSDFQDLAAGETRQVTFTYEAVDDSGTANDTSEPATVTITITGTNDKPTAEVESISATEDGAAVTGNFGAADADTTDTHTFNILTQPSEGSVTNNGDGTFSFSPGSDFQDLAAGETRQVTFTYEAVDDSGTATDTSEPATVTITITGTNDKPTAEVESISATEDGAAVTGNFGATDADTTDTHTFNILTQPDEGSVINNGDGTFSFNPGSDFQDLAAGETRQVTFTYEAVDDSGTANDTSEPATVTITITGTFNILTQPSEGTVTNNNDGTFSFNPGSDFQDLAAGETRQVTFTYEAVDDSGTANNTSEPATVTITVTGTNDAPVAVADSGTVAINYTLTIDVLANDTDVDSDDSTANFSLDSVYITSISDSDGSRVLNGGTVSIENNQLKYVTGSDFDYLSAGETATVTVTYNMSDDGGLPATGTAVITITGSNSQPVAEAVGLDTPVEDGSAISGNFRVTDENQSDTHTFNILTQPDEGSVTNNNDGTFSFSPGSDFQDLAAGETRQVTFTYEAV